MRKLLLVIRREFKLRVRTRTFVLSTVGLPALMFAAFLLPVYVASKHAETTVRLAIVDEAGGLARLTADRLAARKNPAGKAEFAVVTTIEQPADPQRVIERLRDKVRAGTLDGFLMLPPSVLKSGAAEFHTRNPGDVDLSSSLENATTQAVVAGRLAAEQVRVGDLDTLLARVNVNIVRISASGESEERGQTLEAAIFLAIILYTSLLLYGITTMRSVQEEKATRVMEILLSSVRPFPLLAGKILGVGAVGFSQYLIWTIAGAAVVGYGAQMMAMFSASGTGFHLHFPAGLWVWFIVYFLGGYFLYASLFAAVGAAVSSEQEINQAQMPITMLLVAGFLMFPVVARSPGSGLSIALTMIPFFSPVLMMLRIALESPPLWQVLLSVCILAGTTVGMVYISAKIYRVGVLMYGKRPSLVEMLRWLRYT